MKLLQKILLVIFFLFSFFLFSPGVSADEGLTIKLFWAEGCPHCAKEEIFLRGLKERYPDVTFEDYEVSKNPENYLKLQEVGRKLEADVSGVPFTLIGDEYISGYLDDETTGKQIENLVIKKLALNSDSSEQIIKDSDTLIKLPFVGRVDAKSLSLPVLTFLVALLDGFNPCAMWTLIFLISLLLGMKDKKKMWFFGISFIFVSGLVYFLFLSAWLNLFLFLGFIFWVRIVIAILALGAGIYYLRDYWVNRSGACKVVGGEKKQKTMNKIRAIVSERHFLVGLIGIITLAFAVNLIELVCSAGLPAIYTQILSLSNLPTWKYYLYLLFYIIIFMIDDIFVFLAAVLTLQSVGIQSKYSRFSRLIGGILMLVIGIILLFKPELLMFG